MPIGRRPVRTIEVNLADPDEVQRWKTGAEGYVDSLPEWGRHYLYTKPFAPITGTIEREHYCYFQDFANILQLLNLPPGSRILDAACGPGWLSEFLWRVGYDVTGIDVCEALLDVARERIDKLPFLPWERDRKSVRFARLDLESEDLAAEQFDAIVFYDCLHHFADIGGVFRAVDRMLAPGGSVLIKEGAMPEAGSIGESKLLEEAARSTTLESPFDHEWLVTFLRDHGFSRVRRYLEINGFFEATPEQRDRLTALFDAPPSMNIILCRRDEADGFVATIAIEEWVIDERGDLRITARVTNDGSRSWRANSELRPGSVAMGIKVEDARGRVIEEYLGRCPLATDVEPGASTTFWLVYPLSQIDVPVGANIRLDMVLQGEFWFSDRGSPSVVRAVGL